MHQYRGAELDMDRFLVPIVIDHVLDHPFIRIQELLNLLGKKDP